MSSRVSPRAIGRPIRAPTPTITSSCRETTRPECVLYSVARHGGSHTTLAITQRGERLRFVPVNRPPGKYCIQLGRLPGLLCFIDATSNRLASADWARLCGTLVSLIAKEPAADTTVVTNKSCRPKFNPEPMI